MQWSWYFRSRGLPEAQPRGFTELHTSWQTITVAKGGVNVPSGLSVNDSTESRADGSGWLASGKQPG